MSIGTFCCARSVKSLWVITTSTSSGRSLIAMFVTSISIDASLNFFFNKEAPIALEPIPASQAKMILSTLTGVVMGLLVRRRCCTCLFFGPGKLIGYAALLPFHSFHFRCCCFNILFFFITARFKNNSGDEKDTTVATTTPEMTAK